MSKYFSVHNIVMDPGMSFTRDIFAFLRAIKGA